MKNMRRRIFRLLAAALCCSAGMVMGVYHSNFEVPYDVHIKKASGDHLIKFGLYGEYGIESSKGYDDGGSQVDPAQIYASTESARHMLRVSEALLTFPTSGYSATDFPQGLDWSLWSGGPLSLETAWGDFTPSVNVQQSSATIWGRALVDYGTIPGQFFLGLALPVRSVKVSDVTWTDLTDSTADADNPTWITNLTSKLAKYTLAAGNLNIDAWSARGLGDSTVYFGWANDLHHGDGTIKKVGVHVSAGILFPTGVKRNEDYAFSVPFGNDGSWGIPLCAGFNANVGEDLKFGAVIDALWLASNSKVRRLKTDVRQSEYLLLTKGSVTVKPGLTLKANLNGTYRLSDSCKLSLAYQYINHAKDTLSGVPTGYDESVVNTQNVLGAWTTQDVTAKVHFEGFFGAEEGDDRDANEVNLSLFYKMPLTGVRAVRNASVGAELYFSF